MMVVWVRALCFLLNVTCHIRPSHDDMILIRRSTLCAQGCRGGQRGRRQEYHARGAHPWGAGQWEGSGQTETVQAQA